MKEANEWRIWNDADKRNIQNKATNKTNLYLYKTYIDTLKYRYGSINKIVMCVYVRVCVCVYNKHNYNYWKVKCKKCPIHAEVIF